MKFFRPYFNSRRAALTLLEMMVSVTLLAMIMIGLLAMFQQTQKALHVAHTQTDVFENARGAMQLVCRDLSEMTALGDSETTHAWFYRDRNGSPVNPLTLPSGSNQAVAVYNEMFWLTRVNDDWQGIGYYVGEDPMVKGSSGVGTLYRFSSQSRRDRVGRLLGEFQNLTADAHRVSDGIVHFYMEVVRLDTNTVPPSYGRASNFSFTGDDLPAFVDVEIGVLEPATLKQFQALTNTTDLTAAHNFLRAHVGKIHFFRERVPIRNFVNPYRANEVP